MNNKVYYSPTKKAKSPTKPWNFKRRAQSELRNLEVILNKSIDSLEKKGHRRLSQKNPLLKNRFSPKENIWEAVKHRIVKKRSKSQASHWSPYREYKSQTNLAASWDGSLQKDKKKTMRNKISKIIDNAKDKKKRFYDSFQIKPERSLIISKTLIRDKVHDPITGIIKEYKIDRARIFSLGNKKPISITGKINEFSPPRYSYLSTRNDKCHQKAINPLTGETKESFHPRSISYHNHQFYTPKSASSASYTNLKLKALPEYTSLFNSQKIYKGMGIHLQKSSIF
ncbi:unnamed protein product [Blepharisma stoltei]|uniref:Ribosomal protein S4 n=1 Tax=Blepharisma stoltei TaxID=1481888 RepID=A0AAU9KAC0_9CILI|nr:unnamed protein product [Blepharisma stoltei]